MPRTKRIKGLNRLIPYLLLLLIAWSCHRARQAMEAKAADTAGRKVNADMPAEFMALNAYFQKRNGDRIDTVQEIPRSLMARFIKGPNFDTVGYVSTVNPIDHFGNKYGYFFLIKVNCSYGGACANFYLLSFDKTERYRQTQPLGDEAGEESFISLFSYKLRSDTVLTTWVVRYSDVSNSDKDKVDTTERHVFHLTIP